MTILILLLGLVAPMRRGDDSPAGYDPLAIEWTLPGTFDDALAEARDTARILLIKGVSFGIDELGATCASKGDW